MPRCTPAGARALLWLPLLPGHHPCAASGRGSLAQPAAGRPQLGGGGGGDAGSSGGLRASGAELGCGRATRLAFSVLPGHGRAGQQGRRPPRRGGCLLLFQLRPPRGAWVADSSPATLAAAARRPAASPPLAAGGGQRSAPLPACCGRRAGAPGAAASPCLRFPRGSGGSASAASPALGRARSESYSAARWSGPHVTGGGAACSRHRPRGGSCKPAQAARLGGAGHGGKVSGMDLVPLCEAHRTRPSRLVWDSGVSGLGSPASGSLLALGL